MGLDLIELVMEIEAEFDLKIADAEAQQILTIGDLIRFVRSRVKREKLKYCLTSRTFYRLRHELMPLTQLSRSAIHPRLELAKLIPTRERRMVWRQLRDRGFRLKRLQISEALFAACAVHIMIFTTVSAWWFNHWFGFAVIIPLSWLAWLLTRPFAVHVDSGYILRVAALHSAPAFRPEATEDLEFSLTDNEIADKVRQIVAENLGVNIAELTDNARFVEDLGAD